MLNALETISRILTVPNRKWGPNFEVPSIAGKLRVAS